MPSGIKALFPDTPKSSGISLLIDPAVGGTDFAGLRFLAATTAAISEKGRVELDREGVEAIDSAKATWISRSATANGRPPYVLVKKP